MVFQVGDILVPDFVAMHVGQPYQCQVLGAIRHGTQVHTDLFQGFAAFAQVAGLAGADDILPGGSAASHLGHDMVNGQV